MPDPIPTRLSRREFLNYAWDLSWKSTLAMALSSCAPVPVAPVSAPTVPQKPTQPILDFTQSLSGSSTVESLLPQRWYISTQTGFNLMGQNISKSAPPLVNQPKAAYVSPEAYFHDAPINLGDGKKYKVGEVLPNGQYRYVPLVSLQAIAVYPNQLVQAEGATSWSNVYVATANGLSLSGIMFRTGLIGALANMSISGALQREIEGPRIIRWFDDKGNTRFINLDDPKISANAKDVQVTPRASAKSVDNALPKFRIEIETTQYIPPDGWKPPDKNHCGEDMVELYARMLLSTIHAGVLTEEIDLQKKAGTFTTPDKAMDDADRKPMMQGVLQNNKKLSEVDEKLKKNNCYFYSEGGSVFRDYKLMRMRAELKLGNYSNPNIRRTEFEQIWKSDESIHKAYRDGVNALDGKFRGMDGKYNTKMTSDQALKIARQIIEELWW